MTSENKTTTRTEQAKTMATIFEEKITASQLAYWVSLANCDSVAFPALTAIGEQSDAIEFTSSIGMSLLPGLITCKNQKARIDSLKSGLVNLFDVLGYEGSKKALSEIGISFMRAYVKHTNLDNEIQSFMAVYTCLLQIAEMYGVYTYHQAITTSQQKIAA